MKCCKPNHFLFNPLGVPPDFDPPVENADFYFYQLAFPYNDYTVDTVDALVIDGVDWTDAANTLISFDMNTAFLFAGYTPGTDVSFAYNPVTRLTVDESGADGSYYYVNIYTLTPHTFGFKVTINGVPLTYSFTGGGDSLSYQETGSVSITNINDQLLVIRFYCLDPATSSTRIFEDNANGGYNFGVFSGIWASNPLHNMQGDNAVTGFTSGYSSLGGSNYNVWINTSVDLHRISVGVDTITFN